MQVFALVDGNSFFASCEKVFRPDLTDRPVIVLSNNDGCVVARSKEAKKLGIKMCQPYFEIDEFCLRENVAVFSSNYELYANLSGRMMSTIASQVDCIDPYSIDECFANMSGYEGLGTDLTKLGFRIKDKVFKEVDARSVARGEIKGEAKGFVKGELSMVTKLILTNKVPLELLAATSGLSVDELKKIKNSLLNPA